MPVSTNEETPASSPASAIGRWFVVVIREKDGKLTGLSRRQHDPVSGTPFAGPWGALTEDEATELAETYNADERDGGTAETVELYRYDNDPSWPEQYA